MQTKKGFINPITIAGIMIILAVVLVTAALGREGGGIIPSENHKIICYVRVKEALFTNRANIDSLNCEVRGCLFAIENPLGVFKVKGNTEMILGGKVVDSKRFETPLLGRVDAVTLRSGCTTETQGNIRVLNEEGNILDEKSFNIR